MRVEEIVTDKIIKLLEQGCPPWHKPWTVRGIAPANAISQKPYNGINVLMLACSGYQSPYWLTYKQATESKGNVRKGEKGSMVIFAKPIVSKDDEDNSQPGEIKLERHRGAILRYYTVFNLEQTENCQLDLPAPPEIKEHQKIERCEQIYNEMPDRPELTNSAATRQFQAFYSKSGDYVNIPALNTFDSPEFYYSVLFHELTHSTGSVKRLHWPSLVDALRFGDTNYSKEELVAEMGAAMLAGLTGIEQLTIENSASYLQSWIKRMKSDPKLVISAAAQAQKAVDYILNRTHP